MVSGYFSYPELAWVPLADVEAARLAIGWLKPSLLVRTPVAESRRIVARPIARPDHHHRPLEAGPSRRREAVNAMHGRLPNLAIAAGHRAGARPRLGRHRN
jgi:hypothetical protein